ncbi:unnamed protein product [Hermetia illucens]|uniref:Proteasome assembly chaperone 1 n=1 Tax=Hermetia illucens TaxID=343691 RepID=A0A7R8YZZ3_HERIL|nr:uncharacterized protein LOC119660119 [Hermetia illucens]CAD7092094.1 unnamed protein product [Hermetia illucens]
MDFGEILEPTSRAFWDGLSELEEEPRPAPTLEWHWLTEDGKESYPKEIELFVVIEGSRISEFVNTAILKDKTPICKLVGGSGAVYLLTDTKVVYISEENDLNLSGLTTELLQNWLQIAKRVITISIQPQVLYKGIDWSDVKSFVFIRGINSEMEDIKELEAPNFITGVSAGAAYWRYHKNLSISSYVAYIDSEDLDAVSTEPILKLLHGIDLPCDRKFVARAKEQSHLYM